MGSYPSSNNKEIIFNSIIICINNGDHKGLKKILNNYNDSIPPYISDAYTIHHLFVVKALQFSEETVKLFCNIFTEYQNILPLIITPIQKYNSALFYLKENKIEFSLEIFNSSNNITVCKVLGCTPIEFAQTVKHIFIEKEHIMNIIINTFESCNEKKINKKITENCHASYIIDEKKNIICNICFVNEINILLEPCNHVSVCNECACKLIICPICRKTIKFRRKIIIT
jgi:hypothetical protein